jgi:hypothetical protein
VGGGVRTAESPVRCNAGQEQRESRHQSIKPRRQSERAAAPPCLVTAK